jgi:hypothetical protein
MDFFVGSTVLLGIWAAVGPLVGVRYGQELAKRWQKEHWTNDECRELISTITNTFSIVLKYHAVSVGGLPISGPHDADEMRELQQAEKNSYEIFYSRLFISEELSKREISEQWFTAIRTYETGKNSTQFGADFGNIVREIREIAAAFIK